MQNLNRSPSPNFNPNTNTNPNPNPSPNQALFACASELPSAEYLFVDDGSETNQVTGALPALLRRLSAEYGIRFQLDRYRVSVGFTMAT